MVLTMSTGTGLDYFMQLPIWELGQVCKTFNELRKKL